MKQFIELLNETVGAAFEKAGFDKELGRVSVSNRPDLCEYQCNGAMAGAKKYGKVPFIIAAISERSSLKSNRKNCNSSELSNISGAGQSPV